MISIIIPIYNEEKNIKNTIDNLKSIIFSTFEVLLVNDGSTDYTERIIKEITKDDNRFNLINKPNGGVSTARNLGLQHAKYPYILFLDADDYFHPNILKKLYENIIEHDADISICGHILKTDKGEHLIAKGKKRLLSKEEAFNNMIKTNMYGGYIFNKLFKASILKDVSFNTDIRFMEDMVFFLDALKHSTTIIYDPTPLITYIKNETSVTMSEYSESRLTSIIALQVIIDTTASWNINHRSLKRFYLTTIINLLMFGHKEKKLDTNTTSMLINALKKYQLPSLYIFVVYLVDKHFKFAYFLWNVAYTLIRPFFNN